MPRNCFENVDVKKAGEPLQTVKVWKGAIDDIPVGITEDLIVTVPRGTGKNLTASLVIDPKLEAPIARGQTVGTVKVMLDDDVVREVPLTAMQGVESGCFFKRLWDSIVLFFTGLLA